MLETTRAIGERRTGWVAFIIAAMFVGIGLWLGVAAAMVIGLLWLLPIVLADDIAKRKNRGGWPWGLLLGWLGVLIVACLGRIPTPEELEQQRLERELHIRMMQKQLNG